MKSSGSTETSRCGVIDLFPSPPTGPLQPPGPQSPAGLLLGGEARPRAGTGRASATQLGFADLGWLVNRPGDIHHGCHLGASAACWSQAQRVRPLVLPARPDVLSSPSPPPFQMRKLRLRGAGPFLRGSVLGLSAALFSSRGIPRPLVTSPPKTPQRHAEQGPLTP